MPKVVVPFGEKTVVLNFGDFNDEINVDELTSINYSNLFGEVVTVSALLNRMGILKAEAEAEHAIKKLECDIYIANLAKNYRRDANVNAGKFIIKEGNVSTSIKLTEDSLEKALLLDIVVQNKKKAVINAQKNLAFIDSLYWSVQSKDKKLSVLMKGVTPEEFFNEILEGEVNGILIKKPKDTWTQK